MLDDFCRVNVPILNRPTAGAVVDAVVQPSDRAFARPILRCHLSAAVAFPGSPAWVDLRDQSTSLCCFVVGKRD